MAAVPLPCVVSSFVLCGPFSEVWLDPDGWERRDIIMREKIRPGTPGFGRLALRSEVWGMKL